MYEYHGCSSCGCAVMNQSHLFVGPCTVFWDIYPACSIGAGSTLLFSRHCLQGDTMHPLLI